MNSMQKAAIEAAMEMTIATGLLVGTWSVMGLALWFSAFQPPPRRGLPSNVP